MTPAAYLVDLRVEPLLLLLHASRQQAWALTRVVLHACPRRSAVLRAFVPLWVMAQAKVGVTQTPQQTHCR